MKKLLYILGLLACFSSCEDERVGVSEPDTEDIIKVGEQVQFATSMQRSASTRTGELNTALLGKYKTINADYALTVSMLEEGASADAPSCEYAPIKNISEEYDSEGTLKPVGSAPLLWQSNAKQYAFKAVAGTDVLETDQSTPEKILLQDRLEGYAFSPYTPENGQPDVEGKPNYHTSKVWYQLNKGWYDNNHEMKASEDFKKIPLFLQHQRSKITIRLRAGIGVNRESVLADHAKNMQIQIYSYTLDAEKKPVAKAINQPLIGEWNCTYSKDVNGGDETLKNVSFEAIVEPYDYTQNATTDKIASISVSGLNFSFFASNDAKWTDPAQPQNYNLAAGKHLTIDVTLSSERIVFITAWIVDWSEVVTSTICDDYGQNGDPTVIKSRQDLIDFLGSTELNKAGNVAIIAANELNLDYDEVRKSSDLWTNHNNQTLNATLNLAGASLKTSGRLFSAMTSTANLINGSVVMNNAQAVPSAIAETNEGTIERVNVTIENPLATASKAGLVTTNHGTIHQCTSSLPVVGVASGDNIYIGGIAARSISKDGTISPVIDGCTVSARVKSDVETIYGGGIVGQADGRLTNNTFDYGITLLQNKVRFKNIVVAKTTDKDLTANNNSWPTTADKEGGIAGDNASDAKYDNVLDSQAELEALLEAQYNQPGSRYRISDSFTVLSNSWSHGVTNEIVNATDGYCNGNLYCELDGNGKTITLDGSATVTLPKSYKTDGSINESDQPVTTSHMLFTNITGSVHDLTLNLVKPLIATPGLSSEGKPNATDAIAPLAYAVVGSNASISNVKVKMADGVYVQSATPAGLVCWAHNGATVENCEVKGVVKTWVPNNSQRAEGETSDARRYAGGIVACAADAKIKGCVYHTTSNTLSGVTSQEQEGAGSMNIYYGGILGGTAVKTINSQSEYPQVSVVDCISWFDKSEEDSFHGSVIGYAMFSQNNVLKTGTVTSGDDACQGNWWQNRGVGTILNSTTIETVIGKCSAVTPTQDSNF